jgi:rhomboid protease GluP
VLTRVLVAINVIAFLWEYLVGVNNALDAGGLLGTAVLAGDWWRILTSGFLHENITHILFNMIALWQVGSYVELIYGAPRMAIMYFVAMIGGGLTVTYLQPTIITIGASGAIFGLFGALAIAGLRLGDAGRRIMQQTTGIIVINLVIGFIPGMNISVTDHIGGLIAGTLCGLLLFRMPKPRAAVATQTDPAYAQRIDPNDDPGRETIEHQ